MDLERDFLILEEERHVEWKLFVHFLTIWKKETKKVSLAWSAKGGKKGQKAKKVVKIIGCEVSLYNEQNNELAVLYAIILY